MSENISSHKIVARLPRVVAKLKRWVERHGRADNLVVDADRVIAADGVKAVELLLQQDDPCDSTDMVQLRSGESAVEAVAAAVKLDKVSPMPVDVTDEGICFRNGTAIPGVSVGQPDNPWITRVIDDSFKPVSSDAFVRINPGLLKDAADLAAALKLQAIDIAINGDRLIAVANVTPDATNSVKAVRMVLMLKERLGDS